MSDIRVTAHNSLVVQGQRYDVKVNGKKATEAQVKQIARILQDELSAAERSNLREVKFSAKIGDVKLRQTQTVVEVTEKKFTFKEEDIKVGDMARNTLTAMVTSKHKELGKEIQITFEAKRRKKPVRWKKKSTPKPPEG